MESADGNPDLDVAPKIVESDLVSDEDVKMNGEVNGVIEDNAFIEGEGETGDEQAGSPMSEDQTNGDVAESCPDELATLENGDEAMEVDPDSFLEGDNVGDADKGLEVEENFEEDEEEEEEEVLESGHQDQELDEVESNLVVDEGVDGDKPLTDEDSQDEDEANAGSEQPVKSDVDADSCSESGVPQNSESAPRIIQNEPELEKSCSVAKAVDETRESEKDYEEKPSDDGSSSDESEETSPSKSILSNIKGVDCNTPMSKELEDLSKIGARGSLEITLVKKDAIDSKDKAEEMDKASAPAILTITDASSKVVNSDLQTPKKKSDDDDDSIIELSPDKNSSKKKKSMPINVTPRRSSRNLNKTKSYSDKDLYQDDDKKGEDEDDDVQEVVPTDPLAMSDDKNKVKKTTIVVNDTKKLVEIAAGSKQNRTPGKKEPTLVIIDTNSILSGKGAIPVSTSLPQMSITPTGRPQNPQSFMRSLNNPATSFISKNQSVAVSQPQQLHSQPKPIILPSLTDDMYVVEAPSFIVPYVYEKPPVTPLKEYVEDLEKIIKEREKEEKDRKKAEKEKKREEKDAAKVAGSREGEEEDVGNDKATAEKSDEIKEDAELEEGNEVEKSVEVAKKEDDPDFKDDKKDDKSDTDTDDDGKDSDNSSKKGSDSIEIIGKKSDNYFDNPLGKFFMQIGINLVQEHVQTDLLRTQRRKRDKDEKNCPPEVHKAINSLLKTLEYSKENNKPYKLELQKCQLCNFKTESTLVMAHHLETPHMRNYVYRCNFCTLEVRSPHDILLHMEGTHNVRGRLERAPAFHQCPNCPFEDGQKGKLSRHLLSCAKKYKPERNQEPPLDWEPPAKIPRVKGARPGVPGSPLYNSATLVPGGGAPLGRMPTPVSHSLLAPRGRGRPPIYINRGGVAIDGRQSPHHKSLGQLRPGMVFRPTGTNSQPQVLIPTAYNSMYQKSNNPAAMAAAASAGATAKLLQQPSISITPLPRQPTAPAQSTTPAAVPSAQNMPYVAKPGRPSGGLSKTTFVICEICDGYIKDLEQLRNHMQWIHKVKIHPKMIYNRPPLNCQKCQFRFFTDQGLERHLLGSHGLVTSSMQEAANKGKDGGRCPVCGRVYQWKLLNHVARDHNMSLKPAHLSYKCTVCTATFGMYKQFESHVYSAHSVVAKRVMDKKGPTQQPQQQPSTSSTPQNESLLKPLKINDEITIIPQPARAKTKPQHSAAPPQTKPAKVIEF